MAARSIYLSGSWVRRAELQGYKELLEQDGHFVTSRWLEDTPYADRDDGFKLDLERHYLDAIAIANFDDIVICDTFVSFTEDVGSTFTRGGRHVEYGFALGITLRTDSLRTFWTIGPEENPFYAVKMVRQLPDFKSLRKELQLNGTD